MGEFKPHMKHNETTMIDDHHSNGSLKLHIGEKYNWDMELNESDKEIIDNYYIERKLKWSTVQGAISGIKHLINYTGVHLKELLDIAKEEQKQNLNPYNLTIYKILKGLRESFIAQGISPRTCHTYIAKVGVIFRHNNIYVPELPQINAENTVAENYEITYADLPDKECIKSACIYDSSMKAYILFASSSGTARAECLSITLDMWLTGCSDYIENKDATIEEQIRQLMTRRDVIPTIKLKRRKTYKTYYTCCSPEAAFYVNEFILNHSRKFEGSSHIFPFSQSLIITRFQDINDHFGWGRVGKYRRFRTHMLRKFHASNLGCDPFIIDRLEGRSKNKLHETYIKTNPVELRKIYSKYMHNVMIYPERWDCTGFTKNNNSISSHVDSNNNNNNNNSTYSQQQPVQQQPSTIGEGGGVQGLGTVYMEIGKMQQQIQELQQEIMEIKNGK